MLLVAVSRHTVYVDILLICLSVSVCMEVQVHRRNRTTLFTSFWTLVRLSVDVCLGASVSESV